MKTQPIKLIMLMKLSMVRIDQDVTLHGSTEIQVLYLQHKKWSKKLIAMLPKIVFTCLHPSCWRSVNSLLFPLLGKKLQIYSLIIFNIVAYHIWCKKSNKPNSEMFWKECYFYIHGLRVLESWHCFMQKILQSFLISQSVPSQKKLLHLWNRLWFVLYMAWAKSTHHPTSIHILACPRYIPFSF